MVIKKLWSFKSGLSNTNEFCFYGSDLEPTMWLGQGSNLCNKIKYIKDGEITSSLWSSQWSCIEQPWGLHSNVVNVGTRYANWKSKIRTYIEFMKKAITKSDEYRVRYEAIIGPRDIHWKRKIWSYIKFILERHPEDIKVISDELSSLWLCRMVRLEKNWRMRHELILWLS